MHKERKHRFTAARLATLTMILAAAAAFTLIPAGRALADGDERAATAAEKNFHEQIFQAVAKALPAPPAGWGVERQEYEPLKRVTTGSEKLPFRFTYATSWRDDKKAASAQQAAADQMAAKLQSLPPDKQVAFLEQMAKGLDPPDVSVRVSVMVNHFYESIPKDAARQEPVAGGISWRTQSKDAQGSWREGTTWVFLGPGWKLVEGPGPYMETVPPKNAPALAVQNIVVKIQADPARAKGILAKIDWAALKKLIGG